MTGKDSTTSAKGIDPKLRIVESLKNVMKRKIDNSPFQYDLFGYQESDENKLHRLKCQQEKIRRSFFARYNLVLKELEEIQIELDDLSLKYETKSRAAGE